MPRPQHLSFLPPRLAPSSCLCRRLESILSPLFTAASTPVPAPSSAAASAPRLQLAERLRPRGVELSITRGPVLLEERDVVAEILLLGRPTVPATPQLVELRRGSSASLPQHRLQSCFRLDSRCCLDSSSSLFCRLGSSLTALCRCLESSSSPLFTAASTPAPPFATCCVDSDAVAPVYTAASPMHRLNSSSSSRFLAGSLRCCRRSLATRSTHRGMTSPRLIFSARLVCTAARLGSSVRLSARLGCSSVRLFSAARLYVDSAARPHVGSSVQPVSSARPRSSSFTDSFVL